MHQSDFHPPQGATAPVAVVRVDSNAQNGLVTRTRA